MTTHTPSGNIKNIIENWPFNSIKPRFVPDSEWGNGSWGGGEWASETTFTTSENPSTSGAIWDILVALEKQLDRLDVQLDELQEQRFLQTATSRELEKLTAEVGVTRQTNESEERLRYRARIAKAVTRSDGTLDDLGTVLHALFGKQATEITVDTVDTQPTIQLTIPTTIIDDIPLTAGELESELTDILPVGDSLSVITDETFRLGESGNQGLGEGTLA